MVARNRLVVGRYYWVVPEPAPAGRNEWEDGLQPARFVGRDANGAPLWTCVGLDGPTNWPMRWIGSQLRRPMKAVEGLPQPPLMLSRLRGSAAGSGD
jgi:hypothetical protein